MIQEYFEKAKVLEQKCETSKADFFLSLARLMGAVEMHMYKNDNEKLGNVLELCRERQKDWLDSVRNYIDFNKKISEEQNGYEKGNGTCTCGQDDLRNTSRSCVQDEHEDEQGCR